MRKLLSGFAELYLDLISDSSFPVELTEDLYGLIMDIEKDLNEYFCIKKRWVTIDGRHVDIGGDGDSGAGGGASRKPKPEGYIEPMPKKQFRRIKDAFEKKGGIVQQGPETDDFLKKRNVEGITYNSKTVLMTTNPGRACVFEEMIHTYQYRTGLNDGSTRARIICEIEVQKKLLKHHRAYALAKAEIEQTKTALKNYQNDLNGLEE